MAKERQHEVACVIGPNGSGKTALTRQLIYDYDAMKQSFQSITIFDENNQYVNSIEPSTNKNIFEQQLLFVGDNEEGLIVIDDADIYLKHNPSDEVFRMFRKQRHLGLSIIVQTAAPQDIDPRLINQAKYIYFFRSNDPNITKRLALLCRTSEKVIEEIYTNLKKHEYCLFMPYANNGLGRFYYGKTDKKYAQKGSEIFYRPKSFWQKVKDFFAWLDD